MNSVSITFLVSIQSAAQEGVMRESARRFYEMDPTGVGMAMIAMTVVFIALLLLYFSFSAISVYINKNLQKRALRKKGIIDQSGKLPEPVSGELNAAIALALHFYSENLHDIESLKLTIGKVSRSYSPWSSKIYGLRQIPQRNLTSGKLSLKVNKK